MHADGTDRFGETALLDAVRNNQVSLVLFDKPNWTSVNSHHSGLHKVYVNLFNSRTTEGCRSIQHEVLAELLKSLEYIVTVKSRVHYSTLHC